MSRAITALGGDSVEVRVGGVFSLEQAMDELDPIPNDQMTAPILTDRSFREDGIYMLASLVRQRSALTQTEGYLPVPPLQSGIGPDDKRDQAVDLRVRAPDAQAAALVIGRRQLLADADYKTIFELSQKKEDDPGYDFALKAWVKRTEVSLHSAYLNNAALSDLNLTLVRFDDAVLAYASLRRADLHCSRLARADLRRAFLRKARLQWANLEKADLDRARPIDADFGGARLEGARFTNATIRGAKFEDAVDVYEARWDGAKANRRTTWPAEGFPPGVIIEEEDSSDHDR